MVMDLVTAIQHGDAWLLSCAECGPLGVVAEHDVDKAGLHHLGEHPVAA